MRNTENKTSHTDVIPATDNELTVNLLETLKHLDPKRLLELRFFFSQAFLIHTEEEIFNDSEYRLEWSNNVNYIHELCSCVENYSDEQIDNAIEHSIKILKKEKEVANV